jgi:hypothetical protein
MRYVIYQNKQILIDTHKKTILDQTYITKLPKIYPKENIKGNRERQSQQARQQNVLCTTEATTYLDE